MKKTSMKLIILVLMACFLAPIQALAGDRHVVGGSGGPYHYATIQAAVNDAASGETIYIYDSENSYLGVYGTDVYNEEVVVGKNGITFVGVGDVTIMQPRKTAGVGFDVSGTDGAVFDNLTISSFSAGIYGGGTGATNLSITSVTFDGNTTGVELVAGDFVIDGCTFTNNTGDGVDVVANGNITGCAFTDGGVNMTGNGNIDGTFNNCGVSLTGDGDITANFTDGGVNMTGDGDINGTFINGSVTLSGNGNITGDFTGGSATLTGIGNINGNFTGGGAVLNGNGDVTGTFAGTAGTGITINGTANVYGCTVSGFDHGIDIQGGTVNVYDNEVTGCAVTGILVSGDAAGLIYDNNVHDNGIGIDVWAQTTGLVRMYNNCLTDNTDNAQDVNTWASALVRWHLWPAGPGNYYDDYYGGGSYVPGPSDNSDNFPLSATNNPTTASPTVALGAAFDVDFTYTSPGLCSKYPNLKACHFEVQWDDVDLVAYVDASGGSYLPNLQMVTNPGGGFCEFDLTALGDGNFATDFSGVLATLHMTAAANKVGTVNFTIHSEYLDKDGVTIAVTSSSLAVTVEDVIPPTIVSAVLVDSPTDDATYSAAFPLKLDYEVEDDFNLYRFHRRVYDEFGAIVLNWGAITPHPDGPGPVTGQYVMDVTTLPSGNYYLALRLWDDPPAQNETLWDYPTKSTALPFTVDNTPPGAPSFTMEDPDGCADAGWFGPGDVIRIQSTTAEHSMEFSFGYGFIGAVPYDADYGLDVSASSAYPYADDATVNVYMRLIDIYGNIGPYTGPQGIQWSNTAPDETTFGFALDKDRTKDLDITADIAGWGSYGSAYYGYSVNDDGAALTCNNLTTPKFFPHVDIPITLPDGPDGDYTVYFAVRDKAGNVSGIVSDVITLDRTAPVITAFYMVPDPDLGDPCEQNYTIGFHVEWTGEAKWLNLRLDGGTTSLWVDGAAIIGQSSYDGTITLDPGDQAGQGTYSFTCKLRDDVLNYSDPATDDIFIDRTTVTAGTMTLSDLDGSWTYSVNWTDDRTVLVTLTGHSADITHVRIDEVDGMTGDWQLFDPGLGTLEYTITGTECDYVYVYLQAKDCAGRLSSVVNDRIVVDLTDPTLSVAIKGGADKTKSLTNTVNLTAVETCYGVSAPYQMMVSEDNTFTDPAKGDVSWVAFNSAPTHTFDAGYPDGTYIIYVKVRDYAGREAMAQDDIYLDRTPPTCTFVIIAPTAKAGGCPGALAGYTCTPYDNVLEFSGISEDATHMYIQNKNGTFPTGWFEIDPATFLSHVWPELGGLTDGDKYVQVRLRDAAMNYSTWIDAMITLDQTAPVWTGSEVIQAYPVKNGSKAGYGYDHSINVSWTAHPEAQNYGLCYQWTVDYPEYEQPFPAYPPTITSNWPGDLNIPSNQTVFVTPGEPGIYFLSIFVRDNAGNWSTNALNCASQDYIGGDWAGSNDGPDGQMAMAEWSGLAQAFYSTKGVDAHYNDSCDIGPTNTGWIDGYTLHDDKINFDDMVIFTYNYDLYAVGARGGILPPIKEKSGIGGNVIVSTEMPKSFKAGDKFDVVINVSDPEAVKCLSMTFDYDVQLLEAISVEPGSMFTPATAFLLNQVSGSQINLDGTILGPDATFSNPEAAIIHFQAKTDGSFEFNEPLLDLRDGVNNRMEVQFRNVYTSPQAIPVTFALAQNYPNPFNPATTIDLSLPRACNWRVDIYNIAGQLVKTFSGYDEPGRISVNWDGTDAQGNGVASGVYFYRANADEGRFTQTRKMVMMK